VIGCQRSAATRQIKKKKHGGRSGRRRRVLFSFGPAGILFPTKSKIAPWSCGKTLYTPGHPLLQALLSIDETRPSPLSGKSIAAYTLSDFVLEAFRRLRRAKGPNREGKRSLPTEKELSSRHLCLHTTDQSYAQDSANLQQCVSMCFQRVSTCIATMLQDKLKKIVARITGP